eukprot:6738778-Pyramimonas_sp.AAC.1
MYLDGSETLVCLPYDSVPGASWREKRRSLHQMTIDQMNTLVDQAKGTIALVTNTDAGLLIPSGFLV